MADDLLRDEEWKPGGSGLSPDRLRWLGVIALVVIAGAFFWFYAPGKAGLPEYWLRDIDGGIAQARKQNKPMLLFFTADWCGPCQMLKRDVLNQATVSQRLQGEYVCIVVDLTEPGGPNEALAREYEIRGVPTLILFEQNGRMVDRMTGTMPAEEMLGWLDGRRAGRG